MKRISLLIAVVFFISCGNTQEVMKNTEVKKEEAVVVAEELPKPKDMTPINQTQPYKETIILVGKANRKGFDQEPFSKWFNKNLADYTVDTKTVESLNPLLKGIQVKAFMGTWCGDSKRETPRFYKIMDAADFDYGNLEMITMTRQKDTPNKYEEGLNITNVPTFIFYKNGKEINRIVEYPIESLEKDMLAILSGQTYKHAYAE